MQSSNLPATASIPSELWLRRYDGSGDCSARRPDTHMAPAVYTRDKAIDTTIPKLTPNDEKVSGTLAKNTMIEPIPKGKFRRKA